MAIRIKLNDLNYRYDIYQIISLYYNFNEIEFVEENYNVKIEISSEGIAFSFEGIVKENTFDSETKIKEQIKRFVFLCFAEKTGKVLPWGTLVGIRPSKIALDLLQKKYTDNDIIKYYRKHYLTTEEKARLCIEVAEAEAKIVNKDKNTISIYIGMPFCPTRCTYCSFASNPIGGSRHLVEPYLKTLQHEIVKLSDFVNDKGLNIESVYFGGGTPTSVSNEQFEDILQLIYKAFVQSKNIKEFTVECGRPDSITAEKLVSMKRYAVDRISINPQTMNDCTLKSIGRNHTSADVVEKFKMARDIGFDNINMDIIVGLTGEGNNEIRKTCEEIYKLTPDSITVHGLSVKRASKHHEDIVTGLTASEAAEDEFTVMYDLTRELAASLDMKPYYMYRQKNMAGGMENIGYAKVNKESIYNIQMIEEKQTIIALGADAVSKIVFIDENRIERFGNVKSVTDYISRIDEMIQKKLDLLEDLY
jgi:coproporphyrinogen dehydrogenase HemZ